MRTTRLFPSARPPTIRAILASACVIAAATAIAVAEQNTVKRPRAEVLDAKGSAGDVIETVPKDGSLDIIGHEDPWLKVRTPGGKVGYVSKAVFQASSGEADMSNVSGSATVSPTEASAAGRGDFDDEVRQYRTAKHLDATALLAMQEMRRSCRGKSLKDFETTGRVGVK